MQTLIPMILILGMGVLWRRLEPANISAQQVRIVIGALVINLMAPALILKVILSSPLERELYQIPFSGWTTVGVVLAVSLLLYQLLLRTGLVTRAQAGSLMMASAFGNGMGIGLPAVEALVGVEWSSVPLIYDLLVTVPFVWVGGVLLCAHYGTRVAGGGLGKELLRMPPLWALVAALILYYFKITIPEALLKTLDMIGTVTVPLLLIMVGLSLNIGSKKHLLAVVPVLIIKLLLSPVIAWYAGHYFGLEGFSLIAMVMTAAAPAVVVGIALCDRFELDTELFCTVLTISTVIYVMLAPYIFEVLNSGL